jgi:hypothetical protein
LNVVKLFNIGEVAKSRLWRGFVAGLVGAVAAYAGPAAEAATNCVGAAPGLVEWWPGDGSANGIIAGNNGSLQGNSIASAPGIVGSAFSFDGTNAYVQISDSPTFDQATFTLSAWVQFKSLESQGSGGSPAGDQYLIFKQNSRNSSFEGYDLSKTRVSGGDRFRFLVASAAGQSLEIDGTTLISTGVWYHVAAVRGSNYTQLYVNGQLDAQGAAGFAQDYGTLPLYFGTSGQTFWDHKLNGYLDEVSLYNRALTSAEIAAEYAAGSAGKCKAAAIVSLSPSQSAVRGTNLTLAVNATGYGSLSYQWRFNNSNLSGATSSVLALNNIQATNAGSYTVVVANSLGSVTSSVIALTVLLPPAITTQPVSQAVNSGANATFSVVATGSAPLAYQWISNGSALPGATASSLILASVQPANSGTYSVVVSNSVGAVTSAPAVLTVLAPPAITLQPQSVTNASGTTASFNAAASGSAPLGYQWRWNSSNLSSGGRVSGATTGTLSLSGVQPDDAGSYTLVVSNQAGSVTSAVAVLTVLSAPSIVVPPASLSAAIGSNADFTVTAAGSTPLNYQWQFNGTNLPGAVTTALSLVGLSLANAGSYAVVVSNTFGVITSAPGVLTVLAPPVITAQPQSDTNIPAATASFTVGAGGSAPLSYRWRFNGSPLSDGGRVAGSATATLTIAGLLSTDAGGYSVVVTNSVGSVTSQTASLTMLAPPTILTQPANATVMAGTTAGFGVSAAGPGTLGYQWRLNGSPLAGGTASSLAVSNAQSINAGSYQVIVTNLAGATTSAVATLTVLQPTACASPLSGLAGWWTGDGNANDLIAGNNGALQGGATANGAGKVGAAFTFDGVNSYVQIPDAAALRPASLTLEAWVLFTGLDNPGSGTAPAGDQYIVFKQNSQSGDFEGYDLSKTRRNGSDVFRFLISSGTGQSVELDSATTLVPGVWYHVAAVRGSGTVQLYVNGQLEKQASIGFAQSYGALPLYFGTSGQSLWDRKFYGLLDEVSLYNRALTAQEIAAIYAAGADGKCKAPSIASQPQSQAVVAGGTASFGISATGLAPLGYQWQFNGVAIPGATAANLTLASVQPSQAGAYSVLVSNSVGFVQSAGAVLSVLAQPGIAAQPVSSTNLAGANVTLSVTATGMQPLSYQWLFNSASIAGASQNTLTLSNVQTAATGSYQVIVTNSAGAITSSVATLTIWAPAEITSQPVGGTNLPGTAAAFSVEVAGTPPPTLQWYFNGAAIAGATGTSLNFTTVQLADSGSYTVVATNLAGAATSSVAVLTVWAPPALASAPQSRTNLTGSDITFGVSATGTQPLRYQWLFNGGPMPGATAATVTLTNAQLGAAGSYAVIVTNVAGAITSPPALLTLWAAPALLAQPLSRTNLADSSVTFSVSATGTAPLSYQWLFNGIPLAGATASSFALGSVQVTNAGSYAIVVTNIAGSITSVTAVLTVWVPPSLTVAPGDRTNLAGTATTFSVTAAGTQPLSYQWQLNTTNIPGATNPTLTLNPITLSQAGNYRVIVTNVAGSVTSPRAALTVWMAPAIITQPKATTSLIGSDTVFSVAAIGMEPLAYQWRLNGGVIPGATTNLLTLPAVQADVAGTYDVVITNLAGAVTSSPAALTVTVPAPYHPGAGAVVLVNSHSGKYADFQHFIQPYLDNFGFPYVVQDISTNPPSGSLTNYAVIVIGHSQLDTNQVYLNAAAQTTLSLAVSNGTGLVNFDNNLANNNTPRYQYIQDIFGFTYSSSAAASSVTIPPTEPGGKMQYISALHPTNDAITFRSNITMPGLASPAGVTNIALSGGKPMVAIRKYGAGRALQWGSYDWMISPVLGPLEGMDDLVWRGIVWAGRKPLVMRGMPNLVSFRIDDVSGPVWWGHIANEVGLKPYFAMFINDISESTAADIRGMVTNGNATAAIHSFGDSALFYFDHQHETAYSDTVQSNNFYTGTQWHLNHGIPISKVCATHYSEIGVNAFAGLKNWGMEFVPIEVVPGTVEYAAPYAPWVVAGPYRLYETPQQGQVNWPMLYADWLVIPGHPEMSNTFFNAYCEIRDVASCHEWCPDNDVPGTISRGTTILKRSLDSMAMATLFTHEWYFHPTPCCGSTTITTNNLRAEFQGITNNLAAYQPVYVTLDYASQYMRATRTAKLVSAEYDPGSGQVTATFAGKADLDLTVYTFLDDNGAVVPSTVEIPAFTNAITAIVASLPPQWVAPTISQGPTNQTVVQGAPTAFSVTVSGTAPFGYQWSLNGSALAGASHSALSLVSAQASDEGSYQVVITNAAGAATSAVAILTVLVPPTATVQTTNEMAVSGSTVTLAADVTGSEPMAYQWRLDNTNIAGAQDETLVLTNVNPSQAGGYDLYVTNMAGVATSAVVTLIVVVPPSFTIQPSNTLALVGSSARFTAAAAGSEPLTYQWLFNGTNIDGANGLTLNLANVQPTDAGGYSLLVSNAGGASNSAVARLTVATRPILFAHPPTNGLFTLTLQGDAGLNYLIEATTNWSLWNSLSLISNSTGQVDFTDPATNMPRRFYRARLSY